MTINREDDDDDEVAEQEEKEKADRSLTTCIMDIVSDIPLNVVKK
jgi:hypothetical protein